MRTVYFTTIAKDDIVYIYDYGLKHFGIPCVDFHQDEMFKQFWRSYDLLQNIRSRYYNNPRYAWQYAVQKSSIKFVSIYTTKPCTCLSQTLSARRMLSRYLCRLYTPATPEKVPETWLRTRSITCGSTSNLAMPVAAVRRKS